MIFLVSLINILNEYHILMYVKSKAAHGAAYNESTTAPKETIYLRFLS